MIDWVAVYCSTSIANFKTKLARKFNLPEWHFLKSMGKSAVFFGMYNPVDYYRFLWHRGSKTVFWCGSDILTLQKRRRWQKILASSKARHICENVVEQKALEDMGIKSDIRPCLIDRIDYTEVSFRPTKRPHVYMAAQPGREVEYGIDLVASIADQVPNVTFHIFGVDGLDRHNIIYHGKIPNKEFNRRIRKFQGGLRLNEFDGFSEVLARSALMAQYPISVIPYPHMLNTTRDTLVDTLKELSKKTKPNYEGRKYWINELNKWHGGLY